jgi:hypothetical protein
MSMSGVLCGGLRMWISWPVSFSVPVPGRAAFGIGEYNFLVGIANFIDEGRQCQAKKMKKNETGNLAFHHPPQRADPREPVAVRSGPVRACRFFSPSASRRHYKLFFAPAPHGATTNSASPKVDAASPPRVVPVHPYPYPFSFFVYVCRFAVYVSDGAHARATVRSGPVRACRFFSPSASRRHYKLFFAPAPHGATTNSFSPSAPRRHYKLCIAQSGRGVPAACRPRPRTRQYSPLLTLTKQTQRGKRGLGG